MTVVTNRPSPILPSLLTAGRTAIVETGAAVSMGKAFDEKPVLTGPFKVERFQAGKELVAIRNDDYWSDRPLVDRLVVTHISDNNSLILAL
jgi:peptide/nickel transport system substrate-binding protein